MALELEAKTLMTPDPGQQEALSVQDRAKVKTSRVDTVDGPVFWRIAQQADELTEWWQPRRDKDLDKLWKNETILGGAVFSMAAKLAAAKWKIAGPKAKVDQYTWMLENAEFGLGWQGFIFKVITDLLTQDNGMFWELLRPKGAGPDTPVMGIAHLDSQRARRTGVADAPVSYLSYKTGQRHLLEWWQVYLAANMPSPREEYRGVGMSSVSLAAQAAMVLRDVTIYKRQKVGGKNIPALIFAQGIRRGAVQEAIEEAMEVQLSQGFSHYTKPVVIASPDPGMSLSVELMELASLPDGYDEDTTHKWYVAILALCFGTDYSDFAPLPGRGLGSATEATVQAEKSSRKGPGTMFAMVERGINWAVLPDDCRFQFVGQEPAENRDKAEIAERYGKVLKDLVDAQILSAAQALFVGTDWLGLPAVFLEELDSGTQQNTGGGRVGDTEGGVNEEIDKPESEKALELVLDLARKQEEDHTEEALATLLALYTREIEDVYMDWTQETASALETAPEDDRDAILTAAVSTLLVDLDRLGEEYITKAFEDGIGDTDGATPSASDRADLAAAIASNGAFLAASLGPDLIDRFGAKADTEGFTWSEEDIGGVLGGLLWRPLQYVDAIIAPFWRGVGVAVAVSAALRPVRRLLDLEAEHCPTCIPKAGVYPNWAAMVSQVGIPGDGSDDCGTHCRCYIEVQSATTGAWVPLP